jgi:hypothetical protein
MDGQGRARVTAEGQALRAKSVSLRLLCAKTCHESRRVIAEAAIARGRGELIPSPLGDGIVHRFLNLRTHNP